MCRINGLLIFCFRRLICRWVAGEQVCFSTLVSRLSLAYYGEPETLSSIDENFHLFISLAVKWVIELFWHSPRREDLLICCLLVEVLSLWTQIPGGLQTNGEKPFLGLLNPLGKRAQPLFSRYRLALKIFSSLCTFWAMGNPLWADSSYLIPRGSLLD